MASHVVHDNGMGEELSTGAVAPRISENNDKPNIQQTTEYSDAYNSRDTNNLPKNHTSSYKCEENRYHDRTQVRNSKVLNNYLKTHLEDNIEYPIRRTEPCPCNGNFTTSPPQNHRYQSSHRRSLSPVLESPSTAKINDYFVKSLRNYPTVWKRPKSKELTQRKHSSNTSNQPSPYEKPTKKRPIQKVKVIKKVKSNIKMKPQNCASESSKEGLNTPFKGSFDKYSLLYDYYKSLPRNHQVTFWGSQGCIEVRYLATTQMLKNRIMSLMDSASALPNCSAMSERYQQHLLICPKKDCICIEPPPRMATKSCTCSSKRNDRPWKSFCETTTCPCSPVSRGISNIVQRFEQEIPIYPNETLSYKQERSKLLKDMADELIKLSKTKNMSTAKTVIMKYLDKMPMWLPKNGKDDEFKSHMADVLVERMKEPKPQINEQELRQIVANLPFRCRVTNPKIRREDEITSIVDKLKNLQATGNDNLREELTSILCDLPLSVPARKVDHFLEETTDDLMKVLDTSEYEKAIKEIIWDWVQETPSVAASGIQETEANKLTTEIMEEKNKLDGQSKEEKQIINAWFERVNEDTQAKLDKIAQIEAMNKLTEILTYAKKETKFKFRLPTFHRSRHNVSRVEYDYSNINSLRDDFFRESDDITRYIAKESISDFINMKLENMITDWVHSIPELCDVQRDKIDELIVSLQNLVEENYKIKNKIKETNAKWLASLLSKTNKNVELEVIDYLSEDLLDSIVNANKYDIITNETKNKLNNYVQQVVTKWIEEIPQFKKPGKNIYREITESSSQVLVPSLVVCVQKRSPNEMIEAKIIEWLYHNLYKYDIYIEPKTRVEVVEKLMNSLTEFIMGNGKNITALVKDWVDNTEEFKKHSSKIENIKADSNILIKRIERIISAPSYSFEDIKDEIMDWIGFTLKLNNINVTLEAKDMISEQLTHLLRRQEELNSLIVDWLSEIVPFSELKRNHKINSDSDTSDSMYDEDNPIKNINEPLHGKSSNSSDEFIDQAINDKRNRIIEQSKKTFENHVFEWIKSYPEFNNRYYQNIIEESKSLATALNELYTQDADEKAFRDVIDEWVEYISNEYSIKLRGCQKLIMAGKLLKITRLKKNIIPCFNFTIEIDKSKPYIVQNADTLNRIQNIAEALSTKINTMLANGSTEEEIKAEAMHWLDKAADTAKCILSHRLRVKMVDKLIKKVNDIVYWQDWIKNLNLQETENLTVKKESFVYDSKKCINRIKNLQINVVDSCQTKREAMKLIHSILGKYGLSCRCKEMIADKAVREMKLKAMRQSRPSLERCPCVLKKKVPITNRKLILTGSNLYAIYTKTVPEYQEIFPELTDDLNDELNRIADNINGIISEYHDDAEIRDSVFNLVKTNLLEHDIKPSDAKINEVVDRILQDSSRPGRDNLNPEKLFGIIKAEIPEFAQKYPQLNDGLKSSLREVINPVQDLIAQNASKSEIEVLARELIKSFLEDEGISPLDNEVDNIVNKLLERQEAGTSGMSSRPPKRRLPYSDDSHSGLGSRRISDDYSQSRDRDQSRYGDSGTDPTLSRLANRNPKAVNSMTNALEEMVASGASENEIRRRLERTAREQGVPPEDIDKVVNGILKQNTALAQSGGMSPTKSRTLNPELSRLEKTNPKGMNSMTNTLEEMMASGASEAEIRRRLERTAREQGVPPGDIDKVVNGKLKEYQDSAQSGGMSSTKSRTPDPALTRLEKTNPKAMNSMNSALEEMMASGASEAEIRMRLERTAREQGVPPGDIDKVVNGKLKEYQDSGQSRSMSPTKSRTPVPALSRLDKTNSKAMNSMNSALEEMMASGASEAEIRRRLERTAREQGVPPGDIDKVVNEKLKEYQDSGQSRSMSPTKSRTPDPALSRLEKTNSKAITSMTNVLEEMMASGASEDEIRRRLERTAREQGVPPRDIDKVVTGILKQNKDSAQSGVMSLTTPKTLDPELSRLEKTNPKAINSRTSELEEMMTRGASGCETCKRLERIAREQGLAPEDIDKVVNSMLKQYQDSGPSRSISPTKSRTPDPELSRLEETNSKAINSMNSALEEMMASGASEAEIRKRLERTAREQGVPPGDIDKVVNGKLKEYQDSGQSRSMSPTKSRTSDPELSRLEKTNPKVINSRTIEMEEMMARDASGCDTCKILLRTGREQGVSPGDIDKVVNGKLEEYQDSGQSRTMSPTKSRSPDPELSRLEKTNPKAINSRTSELEEMKTRSASGCETCTRPIRTGREQGVPPGDIDKVVNGKLKEYQDSGQSRSMSPTKSRSPDPELSRLEKTNPKAINSRTSELEEMMTKGASGCETCKRLLRTGREQDIPPGHIDKVINGKLIEYQDSGRSRSMSPTKSRSPDPELSRLEKTNPKAMNSMSNALEEMMARGASEDEIRRRLERTAREQGVPPGDIDKVVNGILKQNKDSAQSGGMSSTTSRTQDPALSRLEKTNSKAFNSMNSALEEMMASGASEAEIRKRLERTAREQGVPPGDIDKVVNGILKQNKVSAQSGGKSPTTSRTPDPALSRLEKTNPKAMNSMTNALEEMMASGASENEIRRKLERKAREQGVPPNEIDAVVNGMLQKKETRSTETQVDDSLNNKRKKWDRQSTSKRKDATFSDSDKYGTDEYGEDRSQNLEEIPSAPLDKSEIAEIVEDWLDTIPLVISDPNKKEEVIENLSNYLSDKIEFYDQNSDVKISDPDQVDEIKSRALEIFQDANVRDPEAFVKYVDDLINKLNKANIAKKSAAGPPRPSKTSFLDNIRKIIIDWTEMLPFPKPDTDEEKVDQDLLRNEIAQKLIQDVELLFSRPEIVNDEFIFEKELDKDIESAYSLLPITPELQKKKPHLVKDLKDKLMVERRKLESQSDSKIIRKKMKELIKIELPKRKCMNQDDMNVLEIALDNIADAYLNMAFEPDAVTKYCKKKAFIDEIDEYLNYITRYPCICVVYEEIESNICSALCEFIKTTSLDFVVNELAKIAIKEIINEWLKEMPIKKELYSDDLLMINKMISVLASKLYEMESKEEPDYKDMQNEVHDWLTKIPCEDDGELRNHAEDLVQRLIKSLDTRKNVIQQAILGLSSKGVETDFYEKETRIEDSLTCEDKELLIRIRRRCSLRNSTCVDLPPIPHSKPFPQCRPSKCCSKANDICMIPKPCPQRPSTARCPKRNKPCASKCCAATSSSGLNSAGCGGFQIASRCSPPCLISKPKSSKCTLKPPDCLIPHLPPCVSQSKCGERASRRFCMPPFVPRLCERKRNKPLSSCGVGCLQRKPQRPLFAFNQTPSDGASRKCFLNYSNPVPTQEKGVQASCSINNPRDFNCSGHCYRSRNTELNHFRVCNNTTNNNSDSINRSPGGSIEISNTYAENQNDVSYTPLTLGTCKLTKQSHCSRSFLNGSVEDSTLADNCLENDEQCQTDSICRDVLGCSHRVDTAECHRRTQSTCVKPVSDSYQSRNGCLDGSSRNGNGRFRATISSKRVDCKCSSITYPETDFCQQKQILHHTLHTSDLPTSTTRTCVTHQRPVIDCFPPFNRKYQKNRKKCSQYPRNDFFNCGQCNRLPCPFPAKLYFDH